MVIDVIYNVTLLLSLTVIYAVYPLKLDTKLTIESSNNSRVSFGCCRHLDHESSCCFI